MNLAEVLNAAVDEGFLTATVAKNGVDHSRGFLRPGFSDPLLEPGKDDVAVDLGTGGGLPGLVLAARTSAYWVLIERSARRSSFLEWATTALGIQDRVEVVNIDASLVAHSVYRGQATLVTARSFASPPVTAEIGSAFLTVGGTLVVSEPPFLERNNLKDRWPATGITRLGLIDVGTWNIKGFSYQGLSCRHISSDAVPRSLNAMMSKPAF